MLCKFCNWMFHLSLLGQLTFNSSPLKIHVPFDWVVLCTRLIGAWDSECFSTNVGLLPLLCTGQKPIIIAVHLWTHFVYLAFNGKWLRESTMLTYLHGWLGGSLVGPTWGFSVKLGLMCFFIKKKKKGLLWVFTFENGLNMGQFIVYWVHATRKHMFASKR